MNICFPIGFPGNARYRRMSRGETGKLERRVMMDEVVTNNPEAFLEELFKARHELLTVHTAAALSRPHWQA